MKVFHFFAAFHTFNWVFILNVMTCRDQVLDYPEKENIMDQMGNITKPRRKTKVVTDNENTTKEATERKKLAKEERTCLMEEKKLKKLVSCYYDLNLIFFQQNNKPMDIHEKQEEKLQKEALKAEAAEMKKIQKEKQKWEKGKFALKSIVAEIDSKVVELGSVGGLVSFLVFAELLCMCFYIWQLISF